MFIINDYKCESCNYTFESMEKSGTNEVACKDCGDPSHRIISPVRCMLDGASGDFPGEALKWEKRHDILPR